MFQHSMSCASYPSSLEVDISQNGDHIATNKKKSSPASSGRYYSNAQPCRWAILFGARQPQQVGGSLFCSYDVLFRWLLFRTLGL